MLGPQDFEQELTANDEAQVTMFIERIEGWFREHPDATVCTAHKKEPRNRAPERVWKEVLRQCLDAGWNARFQMHGTGEQLVVEKR